MRNQAYHSIPSRSLLYPVTLTAVMRRPPSLPSCTPSSSYPDQPLSSSYPDQPLIPTQAASCPPQPRPHPPHREACIRLCIWRSRTRHGGGRYACVLSHTRTRTRCWRGLGGASGLRCRPLRRRRRRPLVRHNLVAAGARASVVGCQWRPLRHGPFPHNFSTPPSSRGASVLGDRSKVYIHIRSR